MEPSPWIPRDNCGLLEQLTGSGKPYTYWFITKDDIGAHPDEKDTRAAMGGAGTFMPSSDRSLSHLHVFLDLEDYESYHLQSLNGFHYLGTKDSINSQWLLI